MLNICLMFWESEPQYAYKRYAYKKNMYPSILDDQNSLWSIVVDILNSDDDICIGDESRVSITSTDCQIVSTL